jgi:hypothetical protein
MINYQVFYTSLSYDAWVVQTTVGDNDTVFSIAILASFLYENCT